MFLILLFTAIGFFVGLAYVIQKRKIRLGDMLTSTFLTLFLATIIKLFKSQYSRRGRYFYRR